MAENMASMSRRARSASLTEYRMIATEHFQSFTSRTHTTLFCVFNALPDSLKGIGMSGAHVLGILIGVRLPHLPGRREKLAPSLRTARSFFITLPMTYRH